MIRTEYNKTRSDGVKLYRTYSDSGMMIRKDSTDEIYSEAIDVEGSGYTYTETDIPAQSETEELTVEDTLGMLGELGVNTYDR